MPGSPLRTISPSTYSVSSGPMLPVPRVRLVRATVGEGKGGVPPRPWETPEDMFVLLVVKV